MNISPLQKHVDRLSQRHSLAKQQVKRERGAVEDAERLVSVSVESQRILQELAQQVQQRVHRRIAGVVSRCLEAVFDRPYSFNLTFEQKRGKTEAVITFLRDGVEVDPMTASGGGVVDVACFALRLACLMLRKPPLRRVLVLDEPFRFVSRSLRPRVRELLETLAEEMEVQFVIVTHMEELRTGTVIEMEESE